METKHYDLFYCSKCGTLVVNSYICPFGCGNTQRIKRIDTNGQDKQIITVGKRITINQLELNDG